MKYDPSKIESKWQKEWEKRKLYRANDDSLKPKFYQLETFPYPSAAGLHVGHPKGYIAEDIHARYKRMRGFEVLYTMGWDAFGLPTENYAIKVGKSPKVVAEENVTNFKRQVKMFGLSYDWDREINTSDPKYYKWTQWLFIQFFKKGLAYRKNARVNWCPKDQTVLANEQVIDGKCGRCESVVEQREMEQWFLKITDYADRLLDGLKNIDWPAATKKRQEDWIGKSQGALLEFALTAIPGQEDGKHKVRVFTTRPDTLFGATFLVISPEFAQKWIDIGWQASSEVKDYILASLKKREIERMEAGEKSGIDAGIFAINPANQEKIPVWVADYVLGGYGTGSIMAVPAHDERDFEFAKKFKLPIRKVVLPGRLVEKVPLNDMPAGIIGIKPTDWRVVTECWEGEGELVNSGQFDGMDSQKARWEITTFVKGERKTQYKIRDWSVSRQRYWGVPIPMIHCPKCGIVPVPEKDLPVVLPDLEDYRPKGMPPLASSSEFLSVKCSKCGGDAKRDPETLDTFVDSSWYYLRYADPYNDREFASKEKIKRWMPVDLYVIGAEHTNLHLLYARFISKFLKDDGYLNFEEPFLKLRHVGLIQGADGQKMSKSRGNVVNPDEFVEQYGADAFRIYEMFMGPFEDGQPWDTKGVMGAYRFLNRVFKLAEQNSLTSEAARKALHQAIKKVGEDIETLRFNTAVSELMKTLNEMDRGVAKGDFEIFLKILAPLAPHITEELWHFLGHDDSIHEQTWPEYDAALLVEDEYQMPVQVNGKLRDMILVPSDLGEDEIKKRALESQKVQYYTKGNVPKRVLVVKGKLVSIVL